MIDNGAGMEIDLATYDLEPDYEITRAGVSEQRADTVVHFHGGVSIDVRVDKDDPQKITVMAYDPAAGHAFQSNVIVYMHRIRPDDLRAAADRLEAANEAAYDHLKRAVREATI